MPGYLVVMNNWFFCSQLFDQSVNCAEHKIVSILIPLNFDGEVSIKDLNNEIEPLKVDNIC